MLTTKQLKQADRNVTERKQILTELNSLAKDIDRCEKTITTLKTELETVNARHQGRQSTREDIAYLTDLLNCAKRKLAWEKQIASLQKRTPELLEKMSKLLKDPLLAPTDEIREQMLHSLQAVQAAMERLQNVKV